MDLIDHVDDKNFNMRDANNAQLEDSDKHIEKEINSLKRKV